MERGRHHGEASGYRNAARLGAGDGFRRARYHRSLDIEGRIQSPFEDLYQMQRTPLFEEHHSVGGKVIDFHGWALPVQFAGIVQEHQHTRTAVSVFDCSHMGEFRIRGAQAISLYDSLVISDVASIRIGRARYGAILNDEGGIIDDVVTMRLAEDELYVVTNAGPLDTISALITRENPGAEDVSSVTAKIDVQGPLSKEVLLSLGFADAANLKYFQMTETSWRDVDIVLSRTGYTGELGFEMFLPADAAVGLWRELLKIDSVRPAGLGARDTLRTEMGYLLSGQDFDETRTPLEAGIDGFVAWNTEFRGKAALMKRRDSGDYSVITGIRGYDRRAPRHGFEVFCEGQPVGVVVSGTFAPSLGVGIGLAYMPKELADAGHRLTVGPKHIEIETSKPPFYTGGTCRG